MALQTEREKVAHLLRRFAFGASETELDYYSQGGLKGAIDKLLKWEDIDRGEFIDVASIDQNGRIPRPQQVGLHWYGQAMITMRPLEERTQVRRNSLAWVEFSFSSWSIRLVVARFAFPQRN